MHSQLVFRTSACTHTGTIPLELGGDCSKVNSYELGPEASTTRYNPDWPGGEPVSDPTDGPRGHQWPGTPIEEHITSASLQFRGNELTPAPGGALHVERGVPVDLATLSSHDLCRYASGPVRVTVGPPGNAHGTVLLEGSILERPP